MYAVLQDDSSTSSSSSSDEQAARESNENHGRPNQKMSSRSQPLRHPRRDRGSSREQQQQSSGRTTVAAAAAASSGGGTSGGVSQIQRGKVTFNASQSSVDSGDAASVTVVVSTPTPTTSKMENATANIPSHEDLSTSRADEVTVLEAVYGEDFVATKGVWGCPKWQVRVRPPNAEAMEEARVGSHLLLQVQLTKQYPYVVPAMEVRDVKGGLSKQELTELSQQLRERATELAQSGSVMMVELVQVAEDYLIDHNRDPTMSAWEQMKAREAAEAQNEQAAHKEMARFMGGGSDAGGTPHSGSNTPSAFRSSALESSTGSPMGRSIAHHHDNYHNTENDLMIERELLRQQEALEAARRIRMGTTMIAVENTAEQEVNDSREAKSDDEDDDDFDLFYSGESGMQGLVPGSSRYLSDFVELGVLGRGGGGEVVKVKNRLDRRTYAIKKIILESERGRFAKFGALQNRKLRREVTTISRMTHTNIVRYYQAWVEGGNESTEVAPIAEEEEKDDASENSGPDQSDILADDKDDSESSGWWTNSPRDHIMPLEMQERIAAAANDADDDSLFDYGDNKGENDVGGEGWHESSHRDRMHSDSMRNLLEHENDAIQSPLLTGLGFQNQIYESLYDPNMKETIEAGSHDEDEDDDLVWDESSVKVDSTGGKAILYIQMEYCSTTLRKLIDDKEIEKMAENEVWRLVRQTLEALSYLHKRNVIHRDLKPGNIFLDSERNVKLGDFGLATRNRDVSEIKDEGSMTSEASSLLYDAIDDIRPLLGDAALSVSRVSGEYSAGSESMTGGVGTAFYRAPEQEGNTTKTPKKGDSSYTVQADIFSLGVILFEMFFPPFSTYMERAEILTVLRGDHPAGPTHGSNYSAAIQTLPKDDFRRRAAERFPKSFVESVPENAQRIILWCLERDPKRRPSAEELLASDLLPRKIELEQRYLEEALELLTSSQSESYLEILRALFGRNTPDVVEWTFDTDITARANSFYARAGGGKRSSSPADELINAIGEIRAGAIDPSTFQTLAMSASSLVAATSALKRAKHAGRLGKGGKVMLKRATQRTAGILAMRAATAAAVTGALDGVLGADPLVVERICSDLKSLFQCHGAVRLRCPLMRPRPDSAQEGIVVGGPAELINSRGNVLLLPEDLTAPFARSISRGGSATSHLKRYDIDKVFHKSLIGGHPRETLEASFDIVHEDTKKLDLLEAEIIHVSSQVMSLLPAKDLSNAPFGARSPMWYLRINNTRLADAILDLCGIPARDSLRRSCFHILTCFTSPAPHTLVQRRPAKNNHRKHKKRGKSKEMEKVDSLLDEAVANHGMSINSAKKLSALIEACLPGLSPDISEAIDTLQHAIVKVGSLDGSKLDTRRTKRFEEAAKSLRCIRDLVVTLHSMGLGPWLKREAKDEKAPACRPMYISLDLGLMQRRKHYHGGTIFQCIVLPDNFFEKFDPDEDNETLISPTGRGIKVAEGGNYSELVRRYRPPGNFGSVVVSHYTSARIPVCTGVRFAIGKLVELLYLDAALSGRTKFSDGSSTDLLQNAGADKHSMHILRQSLGHPLQFASSIRVLVASVHGMDAASTPERFLVASQLWSKGISAEYLPHSGVVLSLIKRMSGETDEDSSSSDWSLLELQGACALLKIPFIVIVQPHLLKDKSLVRLRQVPFDALPQGPSSSGGCTELVVTLEDLASTIVGISSGRGSDEMEDDASVDITSPSPGWKENRASGRRTSVECIYVDHDQYISSTREISRSDTPHYKTYLKSMKSVQLSAESFVASLQNPSGKSDVGLEGVPVFAAADLPFFALRDFGTSLMRRESKEQSASGTAAEMVEKYPKHRRVIKTLSVAIDAFMKQQGFWSGSTTSGTSSVNDTSSSSSLMTVLFYSKVDDRFDVITLNCGPAKNRSGSMSLPTKRR